MAYTPPHKRHTKPSESPSPTPVPSQLQRNSKQNHKNSGGGGKILYAKDSIFRYLVVPASDDDQQDAQLPCSVRLKEFPHESIERKDGKKPLIIVCDSHTQEEVDENAGNFDKSPWVFIEKKIQQDLLASFHIARTEMYKDGTELYVPRFVIRFGKILFQGISCRSLDNISNTSAVESVFGKAKKRYYTNVPGPFVEATLNTFVPKLGLEFYEEKEKYFVKVLDKLRPDSTISCKCNFIEDVGELELYKIDLNEARHLVVDISCLDKNLDLRLLLSSKRLLLSSKYSFNSLTDEEKNSLNSLIKSAVIDSEVKGGLRWPLGKESLDDRYTVVGVWHTKSRRFKSSYMKLNLRHADRYDFRTSTGEVEQEAGLRIPELTKQLGDTRFELNPLTDMVTETLKLVWDNFLCWEGSFI